MPSPFALGPTFGVAYVGITFSAILYGITCLQTFIYFHSAHKDGWAIRILVVLSLIVDTIHQAFLIHSGYFYLISNYANPTALVTAVWSIVSAVFLNVRNFGNYDSSVEGSDRRYSYTGLQKPVLSAQALKRTEPTAILGLSVSVAADFFIAISLSYYLGRSRTGFRYTDTLINRLITYTVSTGLITSIITLIDLTVYVTRQDDFYYMFFTFMLAKLHCNSLLATLNTRHAMRSEVTMNRQQPFALSSMGSSRQTGTSPAVVTVHVNQVQSGDGLGDSRWQKASLAEDTGMAV
ncbi:hypothetical protein EWM64_g5659 [Hericium alpestre]|uniref:DUF6534 domain-containing protein n=1 Tax=Hericium alpestre TaxID=135208 RepID=A0A4Y9ZXX1_9AGAM|nr:hypothetical protein EWM64_g5659 [Hericium alpestre]